ncbi:AMP-binding protein [Streptomyces sennicomposti]|uniref:AMP-binding protein n=1 Tax=Streptomyces sennicomposti TaxID=2873384 RepID=UPI001CA756EE|nr:AMP-binding protein [Streptomyces sennicomposti]MBY8864506.1 AMP-binding protein [Streptomyces sennicomposti]
MTDQSIIECLASQPHDRPLIVLDDALHPAVLSLGELRARAEVIAGALHRTYGVGPGHRVCVLGRTSLDLIATLFGIWRAGAAVTVLPSPRGGDADELQELAQRRVTAAQGSVIVTDPHTADTLQGKTTVAVTDFAALARSTPGKPLPLPGADDTALLQFTSGTTAHPRAVAVTQGQIVANSRECFAAGGMTPGDVFVSWLPLFHDMGIIFLTGAIAHGYTACTMATQTFSARPGAWLEAIATYRAAATVAPNFAYGLANRYLTLRRGGYDLSSLRHAVNGAEPIDADALRRFTTTASEYGMPHTAMAPSYGLAEATLAVTLGRHDETYRSVTVDRAALENGEALQVPESSSGRTFVDCGTPISRTSVTITDDAGLPLADGRIGSIRVQGPGTVDQYWTADGSPHPTPLLDASGRLVTGDLGFCLDGRLYVCGRQKDMIIVAGRNLYPEDFEFVTEKINGIRLGNVMAFSLPSSENMIVVAETSLVGTPAAELAHTVRETLSQELSYTPHDVVLVSPKTLPKTTSGKRQRGQCRNQYETNQLVVRASTLVAEQH